MPSPQGDRSVSKEKKTEIELFVKQVKSIGWVRNWNERKWNSLANTNRGGGRVHELKSGKEEGEKKKVGSPFDPQDPIENSLLLQRCISLKIRGKGLVLLQNDILRLIRLTVLMTCLQDNKLEPQGEVTC